MMKQALAVLVALLFVPQVVMAGQVQARKNVIRLEAVLPEGTYTGGWQTSWKEASAVGAAEGKHIDEKIVLSEFGKAFYRNFASHKELFHFLDNIRGDNLKVMTATHTIENLFGFEAVGHIDELAAMTIVRAYEAGGEDRSRLRNHLSLQDIMASLEVAHKFQKRKCQEYFERSGISRLEVPNRDYKSYRNNQQPPLPPM